jgi:hypothetical protein
MEPESSLPHSQVPATCPYPQPTPSSPHNPLPLPEDPCIKILSIHNTYFNFEEYNDTKMGLNSSDSF